MKSHYPLIKRWKFVFGMTGALIAISGCQFYNQDHPDIEQLPTETQSRYGNHSPYKVLGKQYTVLDTSNNYQEVGIASWYGRKFHGKLTSNREQYDMYKMTAAHKTLPLPTFARVTRLDTGAFVIVRINDRGPFHASRVIDLSYAAAKKLGVVEHGTVKVKVEALTSPLQSKVWQPDETSLPHPLAHAAPAGFTMKGDGPPAISKPTPTPTLTPTPTPTLTPRKTEARNPLPQGLWSLQVGAFSQYARAHNFRQSLHSLTEVPINIQNDPPWHRVIVGPLNNILQIDQLKAKISHLVPNPILVPTS